MARDPVRAARVRRMVPDKTTWPGPSLSMKRIEGDRIMEFGVIWNQDVMPDGRIYLTLLNGREEPFDSIEELIAAGWAVD